MGQCIFRPLRRRDEREDEGNNVGIIPNRNVVVDQGAIQSYQRRHAPDPLWNHLNKNCDFYNTPTKQYAHLQWVQYKSAFKRNWQEDYISDHMAMVMPFLALYVSEHDMANCFRAFPDMKDKYGTFLMGITEYQPKSCNIGQNWEYLHQLHKLTSTEVLRVITIDKHIYEHYIYDQILNSFLLPRDWTVEVIPFGRHENMYSVVITCNKSFCHNVYHNVVNINKVRKLTINCSCFSSADNKRTTLDLLMRKIKSCFDKMCYSSAGKVRILAVLGCPSDLVDMLRWMATIYQRDFNMKIGVRSDKDVVMLKLANEPKIHFFNIFSLADTLGMRNNQGLKHLRIQDARLKVDKRPVAMAQMFQFLALSNADVKRISCDVPFHAACGANFRVDLRHLTQLSITLNGPLDVLLTFRSLQVLKLMNYENNNLHIQPLIHTEGDNWYSSNIWEYMPKLKQLVILRKLPNLHVEYIGTFSREEYEYRKRSE